MTQPKGTPPSYDQESPRVLLRGLGLEDAIELGRDFLKQRPIQCPTHGCVLDADLAFYFGAGRLHAACPRGDLEFSIDVTALRITAPEWTASERAAIESPVTPAELSCPLDGTLLRAFEQGLDRGRRLRTILYCPLCGNEHRHERPVDVPIDHPRSR